MLIYTDYLCHFMSCKYNLPKGKSHFYDGIVGLFTGLSIPYLASQIAEVCQHVL